MKNIRVFLSENFQFLEVRFSIYLNRHVFVMIHLKFTIFITRYSAQLVEHPFCTWEVVDSNPD